MSKADANDPVQSDPGVALADTLDSGARPKNSQPASAEKARPLTAEESFDDMIGTVLSGRYEVTQKIGQGGMGAVYEAKHSLIGKRVAVKVLLDKHAQNDQVIARLKQEARLASSIGHENIIDITDFGTTETGRTFVVMEFLEGESLGACIAREGRLDSLRTLHLAKQVAGALAAAHDKGIVHRDIKPENIFLVDRDDVDFVKVVDFGISKSMSAQEEDLRLTQTGMVLGTPLYMSPEQARGDDDLDHRIDIYALGVLLYESLTGEVPFQGKNYLSILTQVTSATPKMPSELTPDIDRDLESIILKAMARDRDERYQTMHEFAADLEALDDPFAKTTGSRITAARWRRRKERSAKRIYILGALGIVTIVGATTWGVGMLMDSDAAPQASTRALATIDAALPPPAPDAKPAPPVLVAPDSVTLSIESTPTGVSLYNGSRLLCSQTPCQIELPNTNKELLLRGELAGYDDAILPITPSVDAGKSLQMALKKQPNKRNPGKRGNRGKEKVAPTPLPLKPLKPKHDKTGELQSNPFAPRK